MLVIDYRATFFIQSAWSWMVIFKICFYPFTENHKSLTNAHQCHSFLDECIMAWMGIRPITGAVKNSLSVSYSHTSLINEHSFSLNSVNDHVVVDG